MKNLLYLLLITFSLCCCNKDDDKPPLQQLPPATQIGAGTFGCLVNGEPFIDNSGFFNCFYQFVDGEYYFGIDLEFNRNLRNLNIGTNSVQFNSGLDIILSENITGEGEAVFLVNTGLYDISTTSELPGNLKITYFNLTQNIVSATFEFTIKDPNTGLVYNVTDGRFDAKFTQ